MILTNSLSDLPNMLTSCFYVLQNIFLTFSFWHSSENPKQFPFQQAGVILFFGLWCSCLISKCSYIINNFRYYFHAKAFKMPLSILFNKFWLCLMKLLVKFTAMFVKYLLRLLSYFTIISLF